MSDGYRASRADQSQFRSTRSSSLFPFRIERDGHKALQSEVCDQRRRCRYGIGSLDHLERSVVERPLAGPFGNACRNNVADAIKLDIQDDPDLGVSGLHPLRINQVLLEVGHQLLFPTHLFELSAVSNS